MCLFDEGKAVLWEGRDAKREGLKEARARVLEELVREEGKRRKDKRGRSKRRGKGGKKEGEKATKNSEK